MLESTSVLVQFDRPQIDCSPSQKGQITVYSEQSGEVCVLRDVFSSLFEDLITSFQN
uniref:Uncharacterized protein n=1 Tax=Anguilla anguilla TaxID=7936 RepID=A0A0E9VAY0_ANGAN